METLFYISMSLTLVGASIAAVLFCIKENWEEKYFSLTEKKWYDHLPNHKTEVTYCCNKFLEAENAYKKFLTATIILMVATIIFYNCH